jgi:type I restriction enzyme S subunit
MSSEKMASTMNQEATTKLVPKLRFPEFRGEEGWKEKPLKAAAEINPANGGLPESFVYIDLESVDAGELKAKDRISRVGAPSRAQRLVERGDIIYQVVRPYQRNNLLCEFDDDENYVASTGYAQLRANGNNHFLYQSIHSDSFVGRVIAKCTGSNYPAINSSDLAEIHLPIPPTLPEQQKIADCLSSLDEMINGQARKVEALKAHKKGLMQQLFPRQGESQPQLRFPEFQDAGEWEARTIGEIFRLINGYAFKPKDWKPTGTPIIRIQNLNDPSAEFNYSQALVPERNRIETGDLLFAWSGTLGSSFGARIWNGPPGVLNQHIFKVLMDERQIASQFALLILARVQEDIAKRAHGFKSSFVHVKKSDLVKVELLTPSISEQHRIASCLSDLDTLITAETQKHETLKTHKKGLMQQLFPSAEEVGT